MEVAVLSKLSAGVVLYRLVDDGVEVLLVHPGGPYWANKDEGAWSIPKGEYGMGEDPQRVAIREFEEETGSQLPAGEVTDLGDITQPGRKTVRAWALEGDLDPALVNSNTFEMEWPPHSGRTASFPEVDRAEWCSIAVARRKLLKAQVAFLDRLVALLAQEKP